MLQTESICILLPDTRWPATLLTMTNNVINRNGIITHGCIKDEVL